VRVRERKNQGTKQPRCGWQRLCLVAAALFTPKQIGVRVVPQTSRGNTPRRPNPLVLAARAAGINQGLSSDHDLVVRMVIRIFF